MVPVLFKMDLLSGSYLFHTPRYYADLTFKAPSHDSERGLPLLDFPYEIYKMILVLILTPGTVYPQVGRQYDLQQDVDLKASQPGFQILATCKRIYSDGFPIFYGKNEFCLPRGKKENAESYFSSLAPKHG